MKKNTFKIFLICALLNFAFSFGQCLTSVNGLYPLDTFTPTCGSLSPNVIATNSFAGEYTHVEVVTGEEYTFASSNPTDYITISTDEGVTSSAFGLTPIIWTSDVTGVIRYYFHLSDQCGEDSISRIKTISCGVPPCVLPQVTFSKTFDCGSSTFEVIADITDIGSANSITVTDNQSSSSQIVASASPVIFGPYAFGTSVILTATNDDTPICNVVSAAQLIVACTPDNDECSGAKALTINPAASCAIITAGSVFGATASPVDAAGCNGTEDDDVWFSFIATDVVQSISLINVAGSTTDLYHSLWTGDCATLTLVPGSCSDKNASIPTGLVAGQTYYLRVYTSTITAGMTSTFDVCIGIAPPQPVNDDCSGAIEIIPGGDFATSSIISSNVSSASTIGLPVFLCQPNRVHDVWFRVTVPASGTLTVETDTTSGTVITDSVLSVYSGTCGALTEIGCDDDNGNGYFSKVVLSALTPGDVLYIGVWTYNLFDSDGGFQVSAYDASLLSNTFFDNESFRAYPNPVQNVLNLSFNKNISNVKVFNLLGQEVMTNAINANQSQIDMLHLASGTYLVKVTADNQVKTIKVIKE